MSDTTTSDSTRFRELDALRGIAALWVVLYHYLSHYDEIYRGIQPTLVGGIVFPDGLNAVYLFFIISGFVIFMTLRHCRSAIDFIVSRFSRLYPVYWAAIAATTATLWLVPLPDQHPTLGIVLVNTTMLEQFLAVKTIDGAYWSLTCELAFYAVMLVLYLAGMIRRIETACWVWLGVGIAANLAAFLGTPLPYRVGMVLNIIFVQYFVAGIVFYLARHDGYTRNRVLLLATCLVAAFVAEPYEGAAAYAALFLIVFHFCVTGRLTVLARSPVLQWLGAISYPLYLTHQLIGYRVIASLLERGVPRPVVLVVTLAGALALATLLSRTIERPAMRLIRQIWRRIVPARIAAAA
jgi:peptidoglycan/LPS O-acetylase OafA/YrhL